MYKSEPIQQCKLKTIIKDEHQETIASTCAGRTSLSRRQFQALITLLQQVTRIKAITFSWNGNNEGIGEIGNKWPCRCVIRKRRPYLTGALIRQ